MLTHGARLFLASLLFTAALGWSASVIVRHAPDLAMRLVVVRSR